MPKPKNDYEIVLPDTNDQANDDEQMETTTARDEDQADIDQRKLEEKRRRRMIDYKCFTKEKYFSFI